MNESVAHIRFLNRSELDIGKWDNCILMAPDGLIYAKSFYLDVMAKNWSALVLDDYEAVMPLTWNRKYGFSYLYQPAFTAQLGIFSKHPPDRSIFELFIQKAKSHYKFCEIFLNPSNNIIENPSRSNYVLDLERPYTEIRKGYKKNLINNLNEAARYHLQYLTTNRYESVVRFFVSEYGKKILHGQKSDFRRFENLCSLLSAKKMVLVSEVHNKDNILLSAGIFFRDQKRIYKIFSATSEEGRMTRAHFYMVDQLIQEFATEKILLDFEGSDIPGIAAFDRKFGATDQPYSFLKFNHLPFPFRLFK